MPQPSIAYACGRVGALGKNALKQPQMDRLMATHTFQEAARALTDIGFITGEGEDFQVAADAHVQKACNLVEEITPNHDITDCFLLRYDIHNLKVLIKSRFLGVTPAFLSSCGTISVETLKHAVAEHRYGALPDLLKKALQEMEKQLAKQFDPMLIDAMLDQAMFSWIFDILKHQPSKVVTTYFVTKVDLQNLIITLRVSAMGKESSLLEKLFLPGGSIALRAFEKAFGDDEKLAQLVRSYGTEIYRLAQVCGQDTKQLPLLEKAIDDRLYQLFAGAKYRVDTQNVVIRYLLTAQREAANVRLIMAGKLNGFSQEEIWGRVRELGG